MFSNFSIELNDGISLEGFLVFENAGEIKVLFDVETQKSLNNHTEH